MSPTKKQLTKVELILSAWESLNSHSVGADELRLIQQRLAAELGSSDVESPASMARTLADAGVQLRHPEVLEADSRWRESQIHELFGPGEISFDSLEIAIESVGKFEELRLQFASEGDEAGLKKLVEHAREVRKHLERDAANDSILAREVVQWLTIWLQTPDILDDWLSLRRQSADFARKFGL